MYIRKASRSYKGKTYSHYLLVESVLTPKGPRQKVICSLGDLSPRPKQDWLALARKLESALTGQEDLFERRPPEPELEQLVARLKAAPPEFSAVPIAGAAAADSEIVRVRVDAVRCEESREAGPVHVGFSSGGGWAWSRLWSTPA